MVDDPLTYAKKALILTACFMLLCSQAFAIEKVQGIFRVNQLPQCASHCDDYYIDPDSALGSILLFGNVIGRQYADQHVEITGTRLTCGGCLAFNVIEISLIVTGVDDRSVEVPKEIQLDQNYPNPFNPSTVIPYAIPFDGRVTVTVFNLMGELVTTLVSEREHAGIHEAVWNAANQPSGIYISQLVLQASDRPFSRRTRKMLFVR